MENINAKDFITAVSEAYANGESGFTCPACGGYGWIAVDMDGNLHAGCYKCRKELHQSEVPR